MAAPDAPVRHLATLAAGLVLAWFDPDACAAQADASRPLHLPHGGVDRTYRAHRPASLGRQLPVPLVIMLNGGFGSGSQAERSYRWDALADREGLVVAYPDGISRSWNAGGFCCGPAVRTGVDDVGFLTRLIGVLAESENIDPARIYLAGMSNGAAMAYRYACEGSYPVAAIGPVAGSLSAACPAPRPVSVIAVHGRDDRHVPFAGGQGMKGVTKGLWTPVDETLAVFRSTDRCRPAATRTDGPVHTSSAACEHGRAVVLVAIEGAGHQWPGSEARTGIAGGLLAGDPPSTALDATAALWSFFMTHPAPAAGAADLSGAQR